MSEWSLKLDQDIKIRRVADDALEIEIQGKKARVLTEDLAALIREELPEDRAKNMFMEMEDKAISKGKMRVAIKAKKDIKKDEMVVFTVDVARYLDRANSQRKKSSLLLPSLVSVRTNNSGFIY